jgi:hypothetical protein
LLTDGCHDGDCCGRRGHETHDKGLANLRARLQVVRESETPIVGGEPLLEIGDPVDLEIVVDMLTADAAGLSPEDQVVVFPPSALTDAATG